MAKEASPHEPEPEGGVATAEEGQVMLDGPDGVAIAMTPEAAAATAQSLLDAAEAAADQVGAEGHPS